MDSRKLPRYGVVVGRSETGELLIEQPPATKATKRPDWWDKTTPGHVYFVQHGRAWDAPIKIGWALDPVQRVGELQMGTPVDLVLLGSFPGNVKLERHLHRHFERFRIRGEWFDPPGELRDLANGRREITPEGYLASDLPIPHEYEECWE